MAEARFHEDMGLNEWVDMFREIYEPLQNNERDFYQVLGRFAESIAACSQFVTSRNEGGVIGILPKVFCWFCSVVHKSGVSELDESMWRKFPAVCPYCLDKPCNCKISGARSLGANIKRLEGLRKENTSLRPTSLKEWQALLQKIYPRRVDQYDQRTNLAHLFEELGELAEAYRIRYWYPDNLNNELADVLTWVIGIANFADQTTPCDVARLTFERYPGVCHTCRFMPCSCVPKEVRDRISERGPRLTDAAIERMGSMLQETLGIMLERQQIETLQAIEDRLRLAEMKMVETVVGQLTETLAEVGRTLPEIKANVESVLEKAKATPSVGGKLKLVLPLVPFVLQYETEVGVSTNAAPALKRLKGLWQKLVESAGGGGPVTLEL